MRLIFDAHLDLAWNTASFDRDLTLSLDEVRAAESNMQDGRFRGRGTVTFPEMRKAGIAVCIGTLLARSGPEHQRQTSYLRKELDYATRLGCYAAAHGQYACYRHWEATGEIAMLRTREELQRHWQRWEAASSYADLPIGVILSMEGADPVMAPETLEQWWDLGLRAIEPAHYGRSHYASGTATEGPLTDAGRALVAEMQRLGVCLDVTHLSDESMEEALTLYEGPVWASHHACRSLVPGDRQLTDEQIRRLCARGGVIGAPLDAWMLSPGWVKGQTDPAGTGLKDVVDHIDHVCQLAGDALHAGIGSDLDGGFGTEQTPGDLNSIADLQRLGGLLADRGYAEADIDNIFSGNFLRLLSESLPPA
ncbi:dipeptidase [Candidatus Laterigemmans baculatus]|uniref:dipeptidase n=1 Tax=Candidatus Laterigemmans baculatus TaxID=2770505 RepID=UPI0013DD2E08|nr:membrane dipeptidase [Candidatus Laterigemmans baculatus]